MKKLLLIVPNFFKYEIYIRNELSKLGYLVDMIYENVDEFSFMAKVSIKIFHNRRNFFDKYYTKRIGCNHYDIVLAIRASTLSDTVLKTIKYYSPDAKFYMYQWDSVENNKNAVDIAGCFDMISTFDMEDAVRYGWKYRPLFFIDQSNRYKFDRVYQLAYICTLHSKRVEIYKKLKKMPENNFLYLYAKKTHFLKEKYVKKNVDYVEMKNAEVEFKPLTLQEVNRVMSKTNIMVDYTHPGQAGFTMRTCEAIGHRCKILTNNVRIYNADFYNPNDVYVYDENHFDVPQDFIEGEYKEIPDEVYNRYKISTWIKDVINYDCN